MRLVAPVASDWWLIELNLGSSSELADKCIHVVNLDTTVAPHSSNIAFTFFAKLHESECYLRLPFTYLPTPSSNLDAEAAYLVKHETHLSDEKRRMMRQSKMY